MTEDQDKAGPWWNWQLFGLWILVNGAAFVLIPLVGIALEQLTSATTKNLARDHRQEHQAQRTGPGRHSRLGQRRDRPAPTPEPTA
jgi:hypothetical protein